MLAGATTGYRNPKLTLARSIEHKLILCAKLGHWPFKNDPHCATAAQVNLLSAAYVSLMPKQESDKGYNRMPDGPKKGKEWNEWKARMKGNGGSSG